MLLNLILAPVKTKRVSSFLIISTDVDIEPQYEWYNDGGANIKELFLFNAIENWLNANAETDHLVWKSKESQGNQYTHIFESSTF